MKSDKKNAIAIDGPAGSGKSTISRLVAEKLGFVYIDTGAMYRALTLKVMQKNIDFSSEEEITELSKNLDIKLSPPEGDSTWTKVTFDGQDITEDIRKMEVTNNVKHIAKIASVRENMVRLQRNMISDISGAVMEGRDIGTVVLADAKHKFYVDASFEERIRRRLVELEAKGHPITEEEVADDLKQRDHTDKTRKVGPLKKADDAIFVDTTDLSIDQVVDKIIECVKERDNPSKS